jgi:hypothetical protein
MDRDALVERKIDDGQKILARLVRNGVDVTAACWLETSEEGRVILYIASSAVDQKGPLGAYRELSSALPSPEGAWISVSEIKLISPNHPIARD